MAGDIWICQHLLGIRVLRTPQPVHEHLASSAEPGLPAVTFTTTAEAAAACPAVSFIGVRGSFESAGTGTSASGASYISGGLGGQLPALISQIRTSDPSLPMNVYAIKDNRPGWAPALHCHLQGRLPAYADADTDAGLRAAIDKKLCKSYAIAFEDGSAVDPGLVELVVDVVVGASLHHHGHTGQPKTQQRMKSLVAFVVAGVAAIG